ncbi:MAG: hypothetical protein MUO70_09880 [Euryarchaeota archaeon]|nr:hypothetical protein [Euryarchaeota archaeon]
MEVFIMAITMLCRPVCWPLGPIVGDEIVLGTMAVAGIIFSLAMLIDCLKRPARRFLHPLTKNGEYDKLIWAAVIVLSLFGGQIGLFHLRWSYFLGAIVYFFVVKQAKTKKAKKED